MSELDPIQPTLETDPLVQEVAPGIFLVQYDEGEHEYNSNGYLLEIEGWRILVDPGSSEGYEWLKSNLALRGLSICDIDIVIGTHCHRDHIQAVKDMQDESWQGEFWLHANAQKAVESADINLTASYLYGEKFEAMAVSDYIGAADNEAGEGIRSITIGNTILTIIYTPGHSSDSMSILVETRDGNILIAGDSVHGAASPQIGSDVAVWKKTLQSLRDNFDVNYFVIGHVQQKPCPFEEVHRYINTLGDKQQESFRGMVNYWV